MKPTGWVGLTIIILAIGFSATSLVKNLTPYVKFSDARTSTTQVQVMGSLDKTSVVNRGKQLTFTIISPEGDRMPVSFNQAAPANFTMATQVTAIGTYNGTTFQANNLLVKCPSKYQGKETEKSYGAGVGGA